MSGIGTEAAIPVVAASSSRTQSIDTGHAGSLRAAATKSAEEAPPTFSIPAESIEQVAPDGYEHDGSNLWQTIDRRRRRTCCFRPYIWALVMTATTGSVLFGLNTALLNTSGDYVAQELGWCPIPTGDEAPDCGTKGNWYKTLVSTAVFMGAAVGALISGKLANRFGLKDTYVMICLPIFVLTTIAAVVANSFSALVWARFAIGLPVGMASSLIPNYIAEVSPPQRRGMFGVMHQLMCCLAQLLAMVLGLVFDSRGQRPNKNGKIEVPMRNRVWWRVMLATPLIPVALGWFYFKRVFYHATPNQYVRERKLHDATSLLRRIYNKHDVTKELLEIEYNEKQAAEMAGKQMPMSQLLKQPGYGRALTIGLGVAIFQQITGINAFVANSTRLFKDAGLSATAATYASIGISAVNVLCTFIPLVIIERFGRKALLFWGGIGMTCATLPATICYLVEWNKAKSSTAGMALAILGACLFMVFFAVSIGPITWIYITEIFPLDMKNSASSLCVGANWIAAIVMVLGAGLLPAKVAYLIFTIASAVFVVFCALLIKETKGRQLGDSPYCTPRESLAAAGDEPAATVTAGCSSVHG